MAQDTDWVEQVDEKFKTLYERMERLEAQLKDNTNLTAANAEVTTEMRDILAAAKGFFKFASYFGSAASWLVKTGAACAALWAAWQALIINSIPPSKK